MMVCADTMSVVFIESQKSLWVLKGNPDICHPRSYCQYYVNFYDHDDAFYLFVVEMCILAKTTSVGARSKIPLQASEISVE